MRTLVLNSNDMKRMSKDGKIVTCLVINRDTIFMRKAVSLVYKNKEKV